MWHWKSLSVCLSTFLLLSLYNLCDTLFRLSFTFPTHPYFLSVGPFRVSHFHITVSSSHARLSTYNPLFYFHLVIPRKFHLSVHSCWLLSFLSHFLNLTLFLFIKVISSLIFLSFCQLYYHLIQYISVHSCWPLSFLIFSTLLCFYSSKLY